MDIKNIFGFEGKNVVITGSASGMSKEATELLLELGANVYAVDLADIDLPVKAAYKANLGKKDEIEGWISTLPQKVDALFLCHGIADKPGKERMVQEINFFSNKYIIELLMDRFTEKASISLISSMAGYGWEGRYDKYKKLLDTSGWDEMEKWFDENEKWVAEVQGYTCSKQSITAYVATMCMNQEFIKRKIRVNAICPGMTNTGLTDDFNKGAGAGDAKAGAQVINDIFLKSWGGYNAEAREMGYPLVVAGSQICSYMSGQNIYVDYGVTSAWTINALSGEKNALEAALEER